MSKWNSPEIVQNNPDDFINETMDLFEAISNRIYKEDNVLYPLVENI